MGSTNNILIPFRFLTTIGHLCAVLMIQYTQHHNVASSMGSCSGETAASNCVSNEKNSEQYMWVATVTAFVCFFFDFLGMLGGFTLFFPRINLFHILLHFIGGVYTSWFISFSWQYESIWYIVGFTNLPTAIVEIVMLLAIFVFKIVVY